MCVCVCVVAVLSLHLHLIVSVLTVGERSLSLLSATNKQPNKTNNTNNANSRTNKRSLSVSLSVCGRWRRGLIDGVGVNLDRCNGRCVVDVSGFCCCDCIWLLLLLLLVVVVACSCCLFHACLLARATIVLNGSFFVAGIFAGRAGSLTFLSHTIQNVSKIVCLSSCLFVCLSAVYVIDFFVSLFRL